jgi:hypothetical protein
MWVNIGLTALWFKTTNTKAALNTNLSYFKRPHMLTTRFRKILFSIIPLSTFRGIIFFTF